MIRILPSPAIPLLPLQHMLGRMVRRITHRQPQLFARLGVHAGKRFLICPANLPVAFLLQPNPNRPRLTVCRHETAHDVRISGNFLTLFDMINGKLDGDALFFSRDISVQGDTGAVVALRNALDDMETTLLDEMIACGGPISTPALRMLTSWRNTRKTIV